MFKRRNIDMIEFSIIIFSIAIMIIVAFVNMLLFTSLFFPISLSSLQVEEYSTVFFGAPFDSLVDWFIFFGIHFTIGIVIYIGTKILLKVVDKQVTLKSIHKNPESFEKIQKELAISREDYVKLSSYMVHEQKNLLAVLRGKIQLKQDDDLLQEVDRMTEAFDDILTMTASEEMNKEQIVDMNLLCAQVVDDYYKIYPQIEFTFDEEQVAQVMGRELWLERSVVNLVDNAIKYGKNEPVMVNLTIKSGSVIVTVQDSGMGIPIEQQQVVFDNRYRIDNLNKDGYGIGLNLVKHVCTLCNGFFMVDSNVDIGTTMYMVLPLYK